MRSLKRAVAALAVLAAAPLAFQVQRGGPIIVYGDTHFHNIAGSGLTSRNSVSKPGAYELLRMPKETTRPALLELRGTFAAASNGVCGGLYMKNFSFLGEWLDTKVVHVRWQDGFQIKVSSLKPAFAGPWRTLENYSLTDSEMEELPDTIKITKTVEGEALKFQVGPKHHPARPTVLLAQGPQDGLDFFLSNVAKLELPEPVQMLGTDKHEESRTSECEEVMANPQYMVLGDKHVWNLASEGLQRNQPGDYGLLRIPKELERPALINVRASFASAQDAPCGLRIADLAFSGEWVANKTVHVRRENGFSFKVSSTEPAFAGKWRSLEDFNSEDAGMEKLPGTMMITKLEDGSAFKFHIGPKKFHKRPTILVSRSPSSDLDISMFYVKRFDVAAEPSAALVTDSNDRTLKARLAECEANRINVSKSDVQRLPALQGLSQLLAPWLTQPLA